MSKIEIYQDAAGEWRWRLRSRNGKVVAAGEGHKTKSGAKLGAQALQRAARLALVVVLE